MPSERRLAAALTVGEGGHRLELELALTSGITLLTGPSGAGKSTCLLALAGLIRPARGRIVLDGTVLFDAQRGLSVPARERKVALVFQSLALFPHLTVAENVAFGVDRAIAPSERAAVVERWLARMRVAELGQRSPRTLSGGEAQRVALARALASAPRLLLLDEPFSALDASLRAELSAELNDVVREAAIPAILVTHHPDEAFAAREVIELAAGRRVR